MSFLERFKGKTQKMTNQGIYGVIVDNQQDIITSNVQIQKPNKRSKLQDILYNNENLKRSFHSSSQSVQNSGFLERGYKSHGLENYGQRLLQDNLPKNITKNQGGTMSLVQYMQDQIANIEVREQMKHHQGLTPSQPKKLSYGMRSYDFQNMGSKLLEKQSQESTPQLELSRKAVFNRSIQPNNKQNQTKGYADKYKETFNQNGRLILQT